MRRCHWCDAPAATCRSTFTRCCPGCHELHHVRRDGTATCKPLADSPQRPEHSDDDACDGETKAVAE